MTKYSHTRISTYKQCGLRYKYKYVDNEDPSFENTVEAFMGDLVHRTLEKLYEDQKYEKTNSKDDLVNHYEGLWEDEWNDDIKVVKDDYDASNYRMQGRRMIEDYYDSYHPFDEDVIGIETYNRYQVTDEHSVSVRIDRLDNPEPSVYEIHDYKTSNHYPSRKEAEQDTQLATYALGVKDMYPDAETIKLVWHYLAYDKEVVVEKDWDELDDIEEQLVDVMHTIETAEDYEPQKSPLCDYCGYQPRCPLWKHKFQDDESTIDAERLASEYIDLKKQSEQIEARLDDIKETLSNYMEDTDIDRVFDEDGRNIYRWTKHVTKFPHKVEDQDELLDALDALGLLDDYKKVDTWSLENDFDSLADMEQNVLKQLGDDEVIERFYYND